MNKDITFNKDGYEPFIDFLKAYAIICVLMGHTFPFLQETGYALWYGMQVPIFILIQAFHVFKKDVVELNLKKIILRIFIPYFIILSAEYIILFIKGASVNLLIGSLLYGGVWAWILFSLAVFPGGFNIVLDKTVVPKRIIGSEMHSINISM